MTWIKQHKYNQGSIKATLPVVAGIENNYWGRIHFLRRAQFVPQSVKFTVRPPFLLGILLHFFQYSIHDF